MVFFGMSRIDLDVRISMIQSYLTWTKLIFASSRGSIIINNGATLLIPGDEYFCPCCIFM